MRQEPERVRAARLMLLPVPRAVAKAEHKGAANTATRPSVKLTLKSSQLEALAGGKRRQGRCWHYTSPHSHLYGESLFRYRKWHRMTVRPSSRKAVGADDRQAPRQPSQPRGGGAGGAPGRRGRERARGRPRLRGLRGRARRQLRLRALLLEPVQEPEQLATRSAKGAPKGAAKGGGRGGGLGDPPAQEGEGDVPRQPAAGRRGRACHFGGG